MDVWGEWNFLPETQQRLDKICLTLNEKISCQSPNIWLQLLNYDEADNVMDVDAPEQDPREDDVTSLMEETLKNDTSLPEATLLDLPKSSWSRILSSLQNSLSEIGFSNFCKLITSWSNDDLIDHSLRLVVLRRLKDTSDSSAFAIFSIKGLALSKPDKLCHHVLVPLLADEEVKFGDAELLSGVFSALGSIQRDLLIMSWTKRKNLQETDWLLLHPLIKDMSQNSLTLMVECIQKFSKKFSKSQAFGRFLVNICKNLEFIGNKNVLLKAVEEHETLLKVQALKHLESV